MKKTLLIVTRYISLVRFSGNHEHNDIDGNGLINKLLIAVKTLKKDNVVKTVPITYKS